MPLSFAIIISPDIFFAAAIICIITPPLPADCIDYCNATLRRHTHITPPAYAISPIRRHATFPFDIFTPFHCLHIIISHYFRFVMPLFMFSSAAFRSF
jgi:hypothetical protein